MLKYDYEYVVNFSNKYNCQLLDPRELFDKQPHMIKIKSRCSHITMVTKNNFIKNKNGIYCDSCINNISNNSIFTCCNIRCNRQFTPIPSSYLYCSKYCAHSRTQTEKTKLKISKSVINTIKTKKPNLNLTHIITHTNGNRYIQKLLNGDFDLVLTNRSCEYNHILKPKTINDENINTPIWLPIEIKYSTSITDNNYYFTMRKNYKNILILCISILDNNCWLFPPNEITFSYKLKINISHKYTNYLYDTTNKVTLTNKIQEYYEKYIEIRKYYNENLILSEEKQILNPHISVEYRYKLKRLETIKFLNFQNPVSNFKPYNFLINQYKIQECVSFISNHGKSNIVSIGKIQNNKTIPFEYNDCDFFGSIKEIVIIFMLYQYQFS